MILSQDLQLALVRDNTNGETARVRVGKPLEGAMAGWTLVELKPRLAVFDGAGLGRQELELTVDTKGTAPPPVAPPAAPAAAATPAAAECAAGRRNRRRRRRRRRDSPPVRTRSGAGSRNAGASCARKRSACCEQNESQ